MEMEKEKQRMENMVQDPTTEEAFVKAKREMQEAIFYQTPTFPHSFEEFEQIIEDIMRGLMDEITQVGRKVCENFVLMSTRTYTHTELELNQEWEKTVFYDESWQSFFRHLLEVKQAKNYLRGMWVQLRDIISEGKRGMPGATCFFPPVLPDTTDLEKETNILRSGEKKLAFELLSAYWCRPLIFQLLELKVQKAFSAGKLDQIKLLAKWYQLFKSPREEVSGNNSEGASSVWSVWTRVDELENWLSVPGNPLVVNRST